MNMIPNTLMEWAVWGNWRAAKSALPILFLPMRSPVWVRTDINALNHPRK